MEKYKKGFSLIEILIAISLFTVIALVSTQVVAVSLRGSQKSESVQHVRENTSFVLSRIGKEIRGARSAACTPSPSLVLTKQDGTLMTISCDLVLGSVKLSTSSNPTVTPIANDLSNDDVTITACSFDCTGVSFVKVSLSASASNATGELGAQTTQSGEFAIRSD